MRRKDLAIVSLLEASNGHGVNSGLTYSEKNLIIPLTSKNGRKLSTL